MALFYNATLLVGISFVLFLTLLLRFGVLAGLVFMFLLFVGDRADIDARHVREADQAVCIGEALPAQSYLSIPAILNAAQKTGA